MIKQIGINALLFAALLVLALQSKNILSEVRTKRALEASPTTYGELIPDKEEYSAGELIRFSYDRTCNVNDAALPLLMLTVDSFENLDTGEVFMGTFASRIVRRNGTEKFNALRRLSEDCTPGTYSFEGWISIQGSVPTQPVPYSSRKFKVKKSTSPSKPLTE